jgi:hypothetical protein
MSVTADSSEPALKLIQSGSGDLINAEGFVVTEDGNMEVTGNAEITGNLSVTGTLDLTNPLPITEGGTGATNASEARINLGVVSGGDLLSTNNLSDVANVATARSNLGLAIGTNVQAYDADLTTLGAGGAEARTFLGLTIGTDVQAFDADIPTVSASQAEMEAGTETALRSMSPLRVKQAITANVVPPTIASTAEAQAGTNNTNVITPLRMREGFNASGSAPVYACRAWVNFNGSGTVAIRASGNVTSITDNGTGDYTVNFTTALVDANYAVTGSCGGATNTGFLWLQDNLTARTASLFRILTLLSNTSATDAPQVNISIHR